jgi:hypothetical protein
MIRYTITYIFTMYSNDFKINYKRKLVHAKQKSTIVTENMQIPIAKSDQYAINNMSYVLDPTAMATEKKTN